ncbi:hypothetical protein AAMO2058_001051800 [Amorphochlora amoebiformis]
MTRGISTAETVGVQSHFREIIPNSGNSDNTGVKKRTTIDSPRAPHISRHRRDPQNPTSSAPDQPGDCKTPVGQVQHQQMPDQLNHILPVLRSMLLRFTVTEEMYLELAGIIGRDYKTNEDRVQAVQRTISTWKQDGLLRLRIPYRRQRRAAPTATHMAPQNGRRR